MNENIRWIIDIVVALMSLFLGFLGGMTYQKNVISRENKQIGDNSALQQQSGNNSSQSIVIGDKSEREK